MTRLPALTPVDRLLERAFLSLFVLAYLVIAGLYALLTPLWQVPDEPAHYNVVRQVATTGCCPIIAMGDWDQAYLEAIKAARFSAESVAGRLESIQYEDHQPPLYYLLAAGVYGATDGNPYALRLFSVLLGAGVVIVAWGAVRLVAPAQPYLALGVAGFVAFLPQHLAMMAGINNDSLTELIVALTLFACLVYVGNGKRVGPLIRLFSHPSALGVLLGLAFLTKLTAYPLVAVIAAAILLRARTERWGVAKITAQLAWVLIPALVFGSLLWLRNLSVYPGLDPLAQAAHDRVVVGQPTTADYVVQYGTAQWLGFITQTTFNSFWGQFGWMGVPMTDRIYAVLLGFTVLVVVGAVIGVVRFRRWFTPPQHHALLLMTWLASLALAAHGYYNLKFIQPQGRYLYPGLIPIAAMVAAGLVSWVTLLAAPQRSIVRWAVPLVMVVFAGFAVYALFRIILPALA